MDTQKLYRKHLLNVEQVQRLRSVCYTVTSKGKRDLAILDFFLFQGLRLIEVVNLKLGDIRKFGNQTILHLVSRDYAIKIHPTLIQSLNGWLDQRGMSLENDSGPVFVPIRKLDRQVKKALSSQTISRLVAKYGSLAGLTPIKGPDRLKPTDLRRSCARIAFDHDADMVSLQAFLGFNQLETVARYIGILEMPDPDSVIDRINYENN